jgi:hypothetical protein
MKALTLTCEDTTRPRSFEHRTMCSCQLETGTSLQHTSHRLTCGSSALLSFDGLAADAGRTTSAVSERVTASSETSTTVFALVAGITGLLLGMQSVDDCFSSATWLSTTSDNDGTLCGNDDRDLLTSGLLLTSMCRSEPSPLLRCINPSCSEIYGSNRTNTTHTAHYPAIFLGHH